MKDYHDMLNSLKNKVVDAAGKAGETVTNAANKVVSDEMRDKVAGAAHAVGDRAKYASRMTRMTVDCNAELERVKRTYTEIGRLYYENYRDTADAFLAELCQQVTDANARVAELEAQMDELRAAAKEYRPAPDLHTVDAEVVEPGATSVNGSVPVVFGLPAAAQSSCTTCARVANACGATVTGVMPCISPAAMQ